MGSKYNALLTDEEVLINFLKVIFDETDKRTTKEQIIDNIDLDELIKLRSTTMNNNEIASYFKVPLSLITHIVKQYDLPKRNKVFGIIKQ